NRHTPKGSPVEIATGYTESGTVRIEVRDHGEGIDDDQREKVFERFYRTDSSRVRSATQGGGAGLGLSIAATIVQQHRGSIGVDETPGGGATFWVELQGTEIAPEQQVEPDQRRAIAADLRRSPASPASPEESGRGWGPAFGAESPGPRHMADGRAWAQPALGPPSAGASITCPVKPGLPAARARASRRSSIASAAPRPAASCASIRAGPTGSSRVRRKA